MFIAIRTDASTDIGTGHVMRCLTLAEALRERGHEVEFICRSHPGNLQSHIAAQRFNVNMLPSPTSAADDDALSHAGWLGCSQQQDAIDTIEALNGRQTDWLITDHYALDHRWHQSLRGHAQRIMVIDDLADRVHDCDLLLDQNYVVDMDTRYRGLIPDACRMLTGHRYSLLRQEFLRAREHAQVRRSLNKVLVFFGGVDQHGLTMRALDALQGLDLEVTVIAGNSNLRADEIEARCADLASVRFHRSVDDMATQILDADLAIGGGGTTTWERCYLGLPAIVITLAENQVPLSEAVAAAGASVLVGDVHTTADIIRQTLDTFITDGDRISTVSAAASELMQDHVGAAGVTEEMER